MIDDDDLALEGGGILVVVFGGVASVWVAWQTMGAQTQTSNPNLTKQINNNNNWINTKELLTCQPTTPLNWNWGNIILALSLSTRYLSASSVHPIRSATRAAREVTAYTC